MDNAKTSLSHADTPESIGDYWDTHDLGEVWEQTASAEFEVSISSHATYLPIETSLSHKLRALAEQRGVSTETLANLWLQERVGQEADKIA